MGSQEHFHSILNKPFRSGLFHWLRKRVQFINIRNKKSLKIPKGQSESVNWRRTDNTMAKR